MKQATNRVRKPAKIDQATLAWVIGELRRRARQAVIDENAARKQRWYPTALSCQAAQKAFSVAASEIERHDQFPGLR